MQSYFLECPTSKFNQNVAYVQLFYRLVLAKNKN